MSRTIVHTYTFNICQLCHILQRKVCEKQNMRSCGTKEELIQCITFLTLEKESKCKTGHNHGDKNTTQLKLFMFKRALNSFIQRLS